MASEQADYYFGLGISSFQNNDFETALSYFNRAILLESDFVEAWSNKGACHYKLKDYSNALEAFKQAIIIDQRAGRTEDYDLVYNMGAALFQSGRLEESASTFRHALEIARQINDNTHASKIAGAANWLAWVLSHQGKNEEALEAVEIAFARDRQNPDILDTKGMILLKLNRTDEAGPIIDSAIGKKPTNKYAWYDKGNLQLKLGKYSEALRCYEKAIKLDDSFAEAFHGKGVALINLKKKDEAIESIKRAIEIKPDLSDAHENLSKIVSGTDRTNQNFLDFWNKTKIRRAAAIALAIFAFGSIIYYPTIYTIFPSLGQSLQETKTIVNGKITNSTIVTSRSAEMPQYYIAVVGLAILFLLMPEIKSFKFGPLEFEKLTEPEPMAATPPTL